MLPGGRGLSANKPMRCMIRCRSFLRGTDSISLTAEGFKTTLYFSTPFQILHNSFVRQVGLVHTLVKCRQILGILPGFGITTIRNPGGPTEESIALREAVAEREVFGPEIVTAGAVIDQFESPGLVVPAPTVGVRRGGRRS